MGFVVVSDTGLEDADATANSYASVTFFLTYWADRGFDYSDYDGEAIQANLVKATDYIERRFKNRFLGQLMSLEQRLSWPRSNVFTREGRTVTEVPTAIREACAEYAARSLLGTALWGDPSVNPNVRKTVTALGPIRDEVEYVGGGLADSEFPLADALVSEFVLSSGGVYR